MTNVNKLLNFIYPRICIGCNKPGSYVCRKCLYKKCSINYKQYCHVCGKASRTNFSHTDCLDSSFLDGLIFVTYLDDFPKKIIHEIKYKFNYGITFELARIMSDYLKFFNLELTEYMLFYVPQHRKRENYRGFNHAKLLAKNISKNLKIQISDALWRKRYTHTQVGFSKKEREDNLRDVFEFKKIDLDKKKAIVVDDVYTTGATLNQISMALKRNGFEKVYGLVFCKSGITMV